MLASPSLCPGHQCPSCHRLTPWDCNIYIAKQHTSRVRHIILYQAGLPRHLIPDTCRNPISILDPRIPSTYPHLWTLNTCRAIGGRQPWTSKDPHYSQFGLNRGAFNRVSVSLLCAPLPSLFPAYPASLTLSFASNPPVPSHSPRAISCEPASRLVDHPVALAAPSLSPRILDLDTAFLIHDPQRKRLARASTDFCHHTLLSSSLSSISTLGPCRHTHPPANLKHLVIPRSAQRPAKPSRLFSPGSTTLHSAFLQLAAAIRVCTPSHTDNQFDHSR